MQADWHNLLVTFFHDPPDKALDIKGHEARARRYLAALGLSLDRGEIKATAHEEDIVSSSIERLPLPHPGPNYERAVSPEGGKLHIVHPLSGEPLMLDVPRLSPEEVEKVLLDLCAGVPSTRSSFLLVWRLLRERLARLHPSYALMPADTRCPDHTLWNHLDAACALQSAGSRRAFLSCSLGPVQPFIAASRSLRDLWSGSMILSWLAFQALTPLLEELGPSALVFPNLRGVPLFDRWLAHELCREGEQTMADVLRRWPELETNADQLKNACLPNRFLALVPAGDAGQRLAKACSARLANAWRRLCGAVHDKLGARLDDLHDEWDARWASQLDDYFHVTTTLVPWSEASEQVLAPLLGTKDLGVAFPSVRAVRALGDAIPSSDRQHAQQSQGLWVGRMELAGKVERTHRAVRLVPPAEKGERFVGKCSLFGSYEQVGPADFDASRRFWDEAREKVNIGGVRIRSGERLCALALVKRFAGPAFFAGEWSLSDPRALKISDTATVAAREWLAQAGIDTESIEHETHQPWNGRWLHRRADEGGADDADCPDDIARRLDAAARKHGKPPAYYAILHLDGDELGAWLQGDKLPALGVVYHPKLRTYFEGLGPPAEQALVSPRPLGPAAHSVISEALSVFAARSVPSVVARHRGALVYAGGDDVLAVVPATRALACALALRRAYRAEAEARGKLGTGFARAADETALEVAAMGTRATISGAVALVHHKEDMRSALEWVRAEAKRAKRGKRDMLRVCVARRSGEHTSVPLPWTMLEEVQAWVAAFELGATDRWAYHLRALTHALSDLPDEAFLAELRRQMQRREDRPREDDALATDRVVKAGGTYLALMRERADLTRNAHAAHAQAREDFVILAQTASFLARGRDR